MKKLFILIALMFNFLYGNTIKELTIAYNANNQPFNFTNNNRADGLLIDIWNIWSKKTGIKINYKESAVLDSSLMVQKGEADIAVGLFKNQEKSSFVDFSSIPIFELPYFIFHHKDISKIDKINSLKAYVVGVTAGYSKNYMENNFKDITLKVYKDFSSLYQAVKKGEIKIFISPVLNFEYFLKEKKITNSWSYNALEPLYKEGYFAAHFGMESLPYIVLYDQLGTALWLATYATIIAAYYGSKGSVSIVMILKKISRFPPLIAFILAIVFSSYTYPDFLTKILELLTLSIVPLALISVGLQLEFKLETSEVKPFVVSLVIKLIISPIIAIFICYIFGWSDLLIGKVSIMESGMAAMITAGVIASMNGLAPRLSNAIVAYGIALSLFTSWILFLIIR